MENHAQTELEWYRAGCPPRKEITLRKDSLITPSSLVKEAKKVLENLLTEKQQKRRINGSKYYQNT